MAVEKPLPYPGVPPKRGKDHGPSKAEADAANAGQLAPTGLEKAIHKFAKSKAVRLGLVGGAAYGTYQAVPAVHQKVDSLGATIAGHWGALQQTRAENQLPQERSLGPQPGEIANWWQELPAGEIQNLASLPEINQIGEKYMSTVSPNLQEKAKQAGYKLIYQADPNDTVGRTVVTKDRQTANKDWSVEDQGFGRAGTDVRGVFKAWIPDPKDPNQKDHIYALLEDPISKKETLARLELKPYDPNNFDVRPTWFLVDDLYNGPSEIARRSKEVDRQSGQELTARELPSPSDPPLKQTKKLTDFPTLNDLLRKQPLSLDDLAKPGDYLVIGMQTAGVDYTKGVNMYKKDVNDVSRAIIFGVRRFGGEKQWQAGIQKTK